MKPLRAAPLPGHRSLDARGGCLRAPHAGRSARKVRTRGDRAADRAAKRTERTAALRAACAD